MWLLNVGNSEYCATVCQVKVGGILGKVAAALMVSLLGAAHDRVFSSNVEMMKMLVELVCDAT